MNPRVAFEDDLVVVHGALPEHVECNLDVQANRDDIRREARHVLAVRSASDQLVDLGAPVATRHMNRRHPQHPRRLQQGLRQSRQVRLLANVRFVFNATPQRHIRVGQLFK